MRKITTKEAARKAIAHEIEQTFPLYAGIAAVAYSDTGDITEVCKNFGLAVEKILKEAGV